MVFLQCLWNPIELFGLLMEIIKDCYMYAVTTYSGYQCLFATATHDDTESDRLPCGFGRTVGMALLRVTLLSGRVLARLFLNGALHLVSSDPGFNLPVLHLAISIE